MSKQQVIKAIRENHSFLITSHINPEGDAIGSQLALASLLKRLNKKVYIVNEDLSRQFGFLTQKGTIINNTNINIEFDVVIILDCPILLRVGKVAKLLKAQKILLNIDHHISNENFGNVNWIDTSASCTGELIYELFNAFNLKLNDKEALYIYVAILTDTGSFRYSNTNSKTHAIVSRLLNYKIKPHLIYERVYGNISNPYIKFLCKILSTLKKEGHIAYITLEGDLARLNSDIRERLEDFVNFARALKDVEVAIMFRELTNNKIKVSFRSKGDFDVNSLAKRFGGGGHIAASGCVIDGTMNEVKRKVLKIAKSLL
ncbi:MAG: bifunctional oligoribonuclease/PAP phosphatase NrnA [Candidatus Omnitrophica bacterium]|nr:bifunctional oligoribonuclease/PAP phosphatase NrnA [Candidatus Omnitrophota bacterium]